MVGGCVRRAEGVSLIIATIALASGSIVAGVQAWSGMREIDLTAAARDSGSAGCRISRDSKSKVAASRRGPAGAPPAAGPGARGLAPARRRGSGFEQGAG